MLDPTLQPIVAFIGHPVWGVPAQYMFEKAFAHHDLDWRFLSLDVAPDHLEMGVRGMRALGFAGAWMDDSFGPAATAWLDDIEPSFRAAGVVDAFTRRSDRLVGFHAGGQAVVDLLTRQAPLPGRWGVVIGSSGPARATIALLAGSRVARLVVLDPDDPDTASEIVEEMRPLFQQTAFLTDADMPRRSDGLFTLPEETSFVVQMMAMNGDRTKSPPVMVDFDGLPQPVTIVDINIHARGSQNRFCSAPGPHRVVSGLDLLIERVIVMFRTWTGFEPDPTVLRDAAEEFLEL